MFLKKYLIILFFGIIFSCDPTNSSKPIVIAPYIATEFNKYNIQPTGPYTEIDDNIPDSIYAYYLTSFCSEGGYDLTPFAGHKIKAYSYPINEYWNTLPLNVVAITDSNKCACVVKTVRAGSTAAPGIFSVNDTNVKKN